MVIFNRWPINEKDFLKKYLTCMFFLYYKINSNFLFFTQNTFLIFFQIILKKKCFRKMVYKRTLCRSKLILELWKIRLSASLLSSNKPPKATRNFISSEIACRKLVCFQYERSGPSKGEQINVLKCSYIDIVSRDCVVFAIINRKMNIYKKYSNNIPIVHQRTKWI